MYISIYIKNEHTHAETSLLSLTPNNAFIGTIQSLQTHSNLYGSGMTLCKEVKNGFS